MCSGLDSYRTCEVWGRSDIVWPSYNNFYSHGEDIEICDAAMDTPINENSRSSQFNITKAFRLDWPKYYVDVIKSLGGVSYRVKHVTSCCQQGGAINLYECGPLDLFKSGVLSNMGILVHIGHCMAEL